MKVLLMKKNNRFTLGLKFLLTKTLKKWLNELSLAFHFLHSFWRPDYSYGQMLTAQPVPVQPTHKSQIMPMVKPSVYQAHPTIQSAISTNSRKSSSSQETLEEAKTKSVSDKISLKGISESLQLEGFTIRLFNGLYTFWENKRLRWGLIFLMLLAPAAKFAYFLFPDQGFGEYLLNVGPIKILNTIENVQGGWYYATIYMFVWSIGELLGPLLSIFGIFLLFPKKYYPAYLVGVPFGYYSSLLFHRMFLVSDYASFHAGVTTTMTLTFLILGIVFFVVSDKVLFKQNHKKRASEARIIGLINMPGMEWNEKEGLIKKEVAEVMKVDNELFIKETA